MAKLSEVRCGGGCKAEDEFLRDLNIHLHKEREGGEEDPPNKKMSLQRETINKDKMTNV